MCLIAFSVQSSVHAMDMIAYYKSQTLAQRKAGAITIPALAPTERHGTEILIPTTHQHLLQVYWCFFIVIFQGHFFYLCIAVDHSSINFLIQ